MTQSDWYTEDTPASWCFDNDPYYFYQHYDDINGFCEGRVMEHQWISCITDFWILGMAFWQFTWDHNFTILRFVSACIAVNATGSFFNHWYGTRQWMVMDNSSMYVELWLIAVVVWDATYSQQRLLFNKSRNEPRLDWGRPIIRALLWTICGFVIWALLLRDVVGCEADPDGTYFIIGIAIPLVSLLANWILFVKGIGDRMKDIIDPLGWKGDAYRQMTSYMKWGVGATVSCAVVWIGVEFPCKTYHWMGWIPAHGIWHVGMSYGLSLIAMWFVCVNSILEGNYFAFKTNKQRLIRCSNEPADKCNDCLQRWFPVVTNNKNHDAEDVPFEFKTGECCSFCCSNIKADCGAKPTTESSETVDQLKEVVTKEDKGDDNGDNVVQLEVQSGAPMAENE